MLYRATTSTARGCDFLIVRPVALAKARRVSEKNVRISYGKVFDSLLKVLASAQRPGSWFSAGALETPMPAIEVRGVGMLSFPVPPAQARKVIAEASERAPYGKGDQTLVDEAVRKVWQVPLEKIRIGGAGWAASLERLVGKIAEELGCEGVAVAAEFYKLLVYEKGGFFLPHRDSEKTGGMFGTLVVTLPSKHEGGGLVIRHTGRETVLDLQAEAPSEIQYAAFYADCEHEVRPVRSGYRICLIYNLVQTKKKAPLQPPDHRAAIAASAPLLAGWASGSKGPKKIVYLLNHHYTEAALSFSALKGADAALAQVLAPAAKQAGCAVHLGIVHIEESGWAEYTGGGGYGRSRRSRWNDEGEEAEEEFEVGEVCDGSYYIDQWRAPDDAPVEFGEIPIDEGEILPPGALDGEPPDESHFSEATGNEGASFERTYLRAALVLWPEARFDQICASAGPDAALARLEQLVSTAKKSIGAKRRAAEKAIREMVETLPPLDEYPSSPRDRLSRLITVLTQFGDPELLLATVPARLLTGYNGAQNLPLLAAVTVVGEERAAALLAAIMIARSRYVPASVLELWTLLATDKATAKSRFLLTCALEALLKSITGYKAPKSHAWDPIVPYGDFDLDDLEALEEFDDAGAQNLPSPETVAAFLKALHASPCASKIGAAIRRVTEVPDLFTPENVLLPALEMIGQSIPPADGPSDLWTHCARHYLERSERPPEPPRDWAQKVTLSGKSPLIRELQAFASNPQEQVHRFRARKELRQEIHRAIERAGLDMTHVTERIGSPQTLVCTKTRATYQRACKQYRSDRSDMRRLLALTWMWKEAGGPLALRLGQACKEPRTPRD